MNLLSTDQFVPIFDNWTELPQSRTDPRRERRALVLVPTIVALAGLVLGLAAIRPWRDLPDIKSLEEIRQAWEGTDTPTVPAIAVKGEGVVETFSALLGRLYRYLDERHDFAKKFGIREEEFLQGVIKDLDQKPAS